MDNSTISPFLGNCIAPFLDEAKFPGEGGFIKGRFCTPVDILPGSPTCCLPCPATQWAYSDNFKTYNDIAEWLNVVGLILLVFMLLSYAVLPTQKTRSHYLSVCLIIAVIMICLGFTIPLGATPDQCYDAITPHDMYSSMGCAWSGAFIVAGGLCGAMWICIRALSMNLQICWDIVPGRKFFYVSQVLGWGIPAILFTVTMTLTGVSFRFGSACHVNHSDSMADFWGPLMGIAGLAGILQLITFGYCMHVYLKNLFVDSPANSTSASGSGLPSYTGSIRTQTARAVYQRLKKVLWLQWRGILIVTIILVDVIFFAIVFVYLDGLQTTVPRNLEKIMPWVMCLAQHPTDKNKCLDEAADYRVNEPTVVAVLILLSMAGIQVFLFLTRPSIFPAWIEFFSHRFTKRQEFVSLDARQADIMRAPSQRQYHNYDRGHLNTTFEMQKPGYTATITGPLSFPQDKKSPHVSDSSETFLHSPESAYRSPLQQHEPEPSPEPETKYPYYDSHPRYNHNQNPPRYSNPHSPDPTYSASAVSPSHHPGHDSASSSHPILHRKTSSRATTRSDYFSSGGAISPPPSERERRYNPPNASFSAPKGPLSRQNSSGASRWDTVREGRVRGGLGLNPPEEEGGIGGRF